MLALALTIAVIAAPAWSAASPAAPPPPRLGDHPSDQADMTTATVLQHLAASMPERLARTPEALLSSRSLRYVTAPDPRALLQTGTTRPDLSTEEGRPLKVLTFNVGLLDQRWMWGLRRTRMPEVSGRRSELPARLLRDDWDVILLQEVWAWADVVRFAEAAERQGYVWFAGSERRHNDHGLVILVRGSVVDGAQRRTEGVFETQGRRPLSQGPQLGAGYLTWSFTHAESGQKLRLATTRLFDGRTTTSWHTRSLQARQLGIDLADTSADTVVIFGGDIGSGPYHPDELLGNIAGRNDDDFWQESTTWAVLQHYGELHDVATAGPGVDDIEAMHALPQWNRGWTKRPLYGWCDQVPALTFTSTDCNPLHFVHHRGELPPSRRDQIHIRAAAEQATLGRVELTYVEPEAIRGRTHTWSHRYGVGMRLFLP